MCSAMSETVAIVNNHEGKERGKRELLYEWNTRRSRYLSQVRWEVLTITTGRALAALWLVKRTETWWSLVSDCLSAFGSAKIQPRQKALLLCK